MILVSDSKQKRSFMDKTAAEITQDLWRNNPNTKNWLEAIQNPGKNIRPDGNNLILSQEYLSAIESISFILAGQTPAKGLKLCPVVARSE